MILYSGGGGLTKYVYPQSGDFRVVFNMRPMSPGELYLELAAPEPSFLTSTYYFRRKRFEDYFGNFSHIYEIGDDLKFEVARSGNVICEWMNDQLIKSYYQNTFFFPEIIDRLDISAPQKDINFECSFFGSRPELEFRDIETSDSSNYSGKIVNNSLNTRLFNATGIGFPITFPSVISGGGKTGVYSFNTDQIRNYLQTDITFDFDFGRVVQTIPIDDPNNAQPNPSGYTSFFIDETNIYSGSSALFNVTDYGLEDRLLDIKLEHLERIGNTYYSGTGYGTGTYSGQINGSGYLQSYNLSGYISGNLGSGYGVKYHYASGQVIAEYAISSSGDEAGNRSTGVLVGTLTGTALPGIGYYSFVGSVTGTPSVSVWHGGVNVSPVGLYTGQYNFTKLATGYYNVLSSGDILLGASAGPISMNGIENHFALTTGEPGYDSVDFTSNGFYAGNIFQHSGLYNSGESYDIEGSISYLNGQFGVTDVAELTVSGRYYTHTAKIYGSLSQTESNDRVFVGYVVVEELGVPVYKSRYYYPDTDTYVNE